MARRNLTQGSVLGNIAEFSLPYLFAYFLQLLYGLADLFIIGQFDGVEATTAVAVGSQVMHFFTVVLVGLAMGSTVMIAKAVGAGDDKGIARNIGNTIILFGGLAILLAAVLMTMVNPLVHILATPAEAVDGTATYLRICFMGIPFIMAYNVIAAVFRGMGDSRSPMYFIAVACLFNIALDYLFIGGMHLGPAGAALGTTLAQALSVLFSFIWIKIKGLGITLGKHDILPERSSLKGIIWTGAPVAIQDGCIQVAFLVITVIANLRGLNDSAAVGIVEKIISLLFLVPSAMLSTVSTLSAQNIGAGLEKRARTVLKNALGITIGYGIMVAVLMQFFADPVVGMFSENADVVRLGAQYLRSYSIDTALAGSHFCFSGYFIACGYSIVSFIHNLISVVTTRIPLSYLFSTMYPDSLYPMGLAAPAGSTLSILICVGFYLWYIKKMNR